MPPATRPCKSCGALIFFARSGAGRVVPLDAHPVQGFELTSEETVGPLRTVYISHFATCPQADQFRKKP